MEEMKGLGMYGLMVPEEYGGMELNNTMYARFGELTGKYDLGLGKINQLALKFKFTTLIANFNFHVGMFSPKIPSCLKVVYILILYYIKYCACNN